MTVHPGLVSAFAPTGTLRASINLGNPILANRNPATGEPVGVSVDLARGLAERLGVDLALVVFDAAGKSVEAVTAEQADIGFLRLIRCAAKALRSRPLMC
jgi:polar amino acid transport system substrate-binding protein